jgi:hypothetical protein
MKKPLTIVLSGVVRGLGEVVGVMQSMYNVKLFGIVTMNSPCITNNN